MTVKGRDQEGYGICIDLAESWIVAGLKVAIIENRDPETEIFHLSGDTRIRFVREAEKLLRG